MSAPHGKKRPADASLEGEQRLSKRFDLLNLGMYYVYTNHRYLHATQMSHAGTSVCIGY